MKSKTTRWALLSLLTVAGCATTTTQGTGANATPARDPLEPKADAPLSANTHFAAGQLAESQGDLQQAIMQYQAALKLEPTAPVPWLRLGMMYTSLRRFDDAIDAWHRYIKVTNNSAAAFCDLGVTLELDQRPGDAEKAYKSAIAREPKNEPARINYGLMLARQGRIDDALTQLQAVLTPAEAHYNIASVLEAQGKSDEAKAQYLESLRLDPEMNDAKSRLTGLDTRLE